MDEVEASLRKERGEKIVDCVREKRDLRQAISRGQGIGDLHLKFVFADTDTLETRILPCHRAQPFPGSAADFKDGVVNALRSERILPSERAVCPQS